MLVDLEWLCGVVARHCPTFFLHPADKYMPCSAEFFLENSELRQRDSRGAVTVLLPRGAVAGPLLLEAQERAPPGSRLWLELDPAARVGMPKASGFGRSGSVVFFCWGGALCFAPVRHSWVLPG